jgi:integrase
MLSESIYGRVWQRARASALTKAQAGSPLAARPYDLRHSGITLSLNAGVPSRTPYPSLQCTLWDDERVGLTWSTLAP